MKRYPLLERVLQDQEDTSLTMSLTDNDASFSSEAFDRVPLCLQAVFMASARGKELHVPPVGDAFKEYIRRKSLKAAAASNSDESTCSATSTISSLSSIKSNEDIRPIITQSLGCLDHVHDQDEEEDLLPAPQDLKRTVGCSSKDLLEEEAASPSQHSRAVSTSALLERPSRLSPRPSYRSSTLTPESYWKALLFSRGYANQYYPALDTAYSRTPTPLQQASHRPHVLALVLQDDVEIFRQLLESGLSRNPSSSRGGESLVCK